MSIAELYETFTQTLSNVTGASDTLLHVHAGMAVLLLARIVTGRSLTTPVPFSAVVAATLVNEVLDRVNHGSWHWWDTAFDVVNTVFWPFVLMVGLRIRRSREALAAAAASKWPGERATEAQTRLQAARYRWAFASQLEWRIVVRKRESSRMGVTVVEVDSNRGSGVRVNKEMPAALADRLAAASLLRSFGRLGSNCLLVLVGAELNIINVELIALDGRELSSRSVKGYVQTALQRGAAGIFLISEAERGRVLPPGCLTFVDRLRTQLMETHCDFIDHLVVNGGDVLSLYGPTRVRVLRSGVDSIV